MERRTATVADVVRQAVEICDPDDLDPDLGRLETAFEDDDRPVTAVDNLEEHLALVLEGVDYDVENPAVAVASAIVLYVGRHRGVAGDDGDAEELIRLAVKAQYHGDPPRAVADWVEGR